ncbi:Coiled-coil domain-containing protein [Nymphon striatum]|nr:Coiled-coil domain-containing protein [Nymphon striatum]
MTPAHSQTLPLHHRAAMEPLRPMSPVSSTIERQKVLTPTGHPQVPPPTKPQREHRHEPQGAYRTTDCHQYGTALTSPDRRVIYNTSPDHHRPRSVHDPSAGYHSSPERSRIDYLHHKSYPSCGGMASTIEDGYFSDRGGYPMNSGSGIVVGGGGGGGGGNGTRSGSVTPIIDEEARIRVQNMERQLASLTGIVQKALSTTSPSASRPQSLTQDFDVNPTRDYSSDNTMYRGGRGCGYLPRTDSCAVSIPNQNSTVFCRIDIDSNLITSTRLSLSLFLVEKPTKPAIKTSSSRHMHADPENSNLEPKPNDTNTSSCEQDKESRPAASGSSKPAPPPKPTSLMTSYHDHKPGYMKEGYMSSEMYSQMKQLRKKSKELKFEAKNLKKITQAQAINVRETINNTSLKIKTLFASSYLADEQLYCDRMKVSREEEAYRQDVLKLEKDLAELEGSVEELRSNVINRRIRVNMSDVEGMALILSKASKTVADLKARFPSLQDNLKIIMAAEMDVIVREEKFLKEEPERLENALRRCKKLTGTLVTLKRLASVQEQRHSGSTAIVSHTQSMPERDDPHTNSTAPSQKTEANINRITPQTTTDNHPKPHKQENVLDALLDELQTFSKPSHDGRRIQTGDSSAEHAPIKRLPSYPSTDSPSKGPPPPPKTTIGKHNSVDGSGRVIWNVAKSDTSHPLPPEIYSSKVVIGPLKQPSIEHSKTKEPSSPTSLSKKLPPPPPPRTSSKSPIIISPSSAGREISNASSKVRILGPVRSNSEQGPTESISRSRTLKSASIDIPTMKRKEEVLRTIAISDENIPNIVSSNSSSSESVNSQEGLQQISKGSKSADKFNGLDFQKKNIAAMTRQEFLELRHQDLLKKQKQLTDQFSKLQLIQRTQSAALNRYPPPRVGIPLGDLKKTGSESNILSKASLSLAPVPSGSLTHLALTSATLPISDRLTLANALLCAKNAAMAKTSTTAPNSTSTSPIHLADRAYSLLQFHSICNNNVFERKDAFCRALNNSASPWVLQCATMGRQDDEVTQNFLKGFFECGRIVNTTNTDLCTADNPESRVDLGIRALISTEFSNRRETASFRMCVLYKLFQYMDSVTLFDNAKEGNYKVSEGMDWLQNNTPAELVDLVSYFDSTYVSGKINRIQPVVLDPDQPMLRLHFRRLPFPFPPQRFNRASLLNIGFIESLKDGFDYLALHDVDLLPLNKNLSYTYPYKGPVHLAPPNLHPLYHYEKYLGGVLLISHGLFKEVNGMSNRYWGWGMEDDEFRVRLHKQKIQVFRPKNIATGPKDTFLHMHDHKARKRDMANVENQKKKTNRLDRVTGVHNVQYTITSALNIAIENIPVRVINVKLICNQTATPCIGLSSIVYNNPRKNSPINEEMCYPYYKKKCGYGILLVEIDNVNNNEA